MSDYTQYTLDEALAIWERNLAMRAADTKAMCVAWPLRATVGEPQSHD
jgi:hypothetical protein